MSIEDLPASLYDAFARVGQALASPHRLRILNILSQSERSVEELATRLDQSMANTSTHLKVLKQARLVVGRRQGKHVYYGLANEATQRLWLSLRDLGLTELPEVRDLMHTYAEEPHSLSMLRTPELMERAARGEVIVLDLRSTREFETGHLPGARSIPAAELDQRIKDLPTDRTIVAYCRGPYCVTAIQGVEKMRAAGLDAHRAVDGVLEWRAAGLPIEPSDHVA
ncbi:ArsR family transcriptional regulator [Lujinxingia litoralis]|uniref:ArsR family transcriptional regulator n=1 Tax=Lujinxingia litoralis TaxID=2211119 RepID=A0A328C742_9DELT|nr:metalloregulator ArsR/SmtB family transcription factor [Lujinxingia litoralis]RAL22274.1 ArsR family transcriptional regulator [Lujinxingia litoralis]